MESFKLLSHRSLHSVCNVSLCTATIVGGRSGGVDGNTEREKGLAASSNQPRIRRTQAES